MRIGQHRGGEHFAHHRHRGAQEGHGSEAKIERASATPTSKEKLNGVQLAATGTVPDDKLTIQRECGAMAGPARREGERTQALT